MANGKKIDAAAQEYPQALIRPESLGIHRREPQGEEKQQGEQHVHHGGHPPPEPPEGPAHIVEKAQENPQARRRKEFRRLTADLLDHRNSRERKPP